MTMLDANVDSVLRSRPDFPPPFDNLFYDVVYTAAAAALTLGWGLRSFGMDHVPRSGPLLVMANHQSFFDPVAVAIAVRRRLCFLARKTLFRHRAFGWLIRNLKAAPIDQEGIGIAGLRTAVAELQNGRAVLVFPEGERSHHGDFGQLKPGIHLLVKRCQGPLLPVGIAGTFDAWPRWRALPRPSPIFLPATKRTLFVSIGEPIETGPLLRLPREGLLDELSAMLRRQRDHAQKLQRQTPHGLEVGWSAGARSCIEPSGRPQ
jgi:1-acyl-sn-glycerol-3-phosphate acyltransferase